MDLFGGVNASAAPGSVSPDTNTGPDTRAQLPGTKVALDGWTLDNNTWQGVRTYDATVGQWNTPDAYAGEVHDPMSQKPFMWNRNNPYAYADPSGLSTVLVFNSETHTLRVIGVSGTKDNGIDKTFHAANNVVNPTGDPMKPGSKGHMPDGNWNLGSMEGNKASEKPAFGNVGFIPLTDAGVGNQRGARGLGIHSGRGNNPERVPEGCIRTTDEAMQFLQEHAPVYLEVNPNAGGPEHPERY